MHVDPLLPDDPLTASESLSAAVVTGEQRTPPMPSVSRSLELRVSHESRISYFMYFRAIVLAMVTAIVLYLQREDSTVRFDPLYEQVVWTSLFLAYAINVAFAWALSRVSNLSGFSWLQTTFDIVLASVVIQLSGGTTSGAGFLFPVAVVGAAIMGNREQTMAATGGCLLVYTTATLLHYSGLAVPLATSGEVALPELEEFWSSYALTMSAILSVGVLSVYLNGQLVRFERQISRLGALTDDMVRSLTAILITVDTHGRVVFANSAALELTSARSVLGSNIEEIFPALDFPALSTEQHVSKIAATIEHAASAAPVAIEGICCPLRDAEQNLLGYIFSLEDVTELLEMRRSLRRSERLAAVGSLAASVAHEVRNPLAAIAGSAELLDGANDDEQERLTRIILRESTRLAGIVDDLLTFTSTRPPEVRKVDLQRLSADVVEAVCADASLAAKGVALRGPEQRGLFAMADPAQLSQVIWNLLRNALEASERGDTIHLSLTKEGASVRLEVRDEGCGIQQENLHLLFEPFFSTKPKGSGFGLALVNRIIEEHGGRVDVQSKENVGTTVTVTLPAPTTETPQA